MAFTVTKIVDRGTVSVSPNWKWENYEGNVVKIAGFSSSVSSPGLDSFAIGKLQTLILNKAVQLKNPVQVDDTSIVCSIFLNDVDILNYFPEFNVMI